MTAVFPVCIRCATPLPANAPQGICPRCLLAAVVLKPAVEIPLPSKPRTPVGDYELLEEIARGGMGIVFRARQFSLNRIVAIKALLFGEFASDEFVGRFRAEAQAAAGLQHPNIVAIYEVWEAAGQHFFSMEYVEGKTLATILNSGPLAPTRVARYIEITARAVHFAHQRGIIHRDLKPSNILIDSADQPRITDFGLAKRFNSASVASPTTTFAGSPHYVSPEQCGQRGAFITPAADIYSLGATLYHMITGRPAFIGESVEEILAQTISAEPVSPRLLNRSISRDLETICLKCLAKDPSRRYASALELAEDLERFLQNLPIKARPITRVEQSARWMRRNPAPTAVLGLLTVIAAATTWASFHFRNLNREVMVGKYVSDMNIAARHLDEGDVGHAITLLKAHVPQKSAQELRGFEWRHMWWVARGNYEHWLPKHPQVVGSIQFDATGERALTFAWDKTARVWNAKTRENILTLTNVAAIGGFAVDGNSLVINRPNGGVELIGSTFGEFQSKGQLIAFAADIAATRDAAERLTVWELQTGRELLIISNSPPATLPYSWASPAKISPDGSKLALINPSANPLQPARVVRVWDLRSGAELEPLSENRDLRSLAFSKDGQSLLTGDGQGLLRAWNLISGESKDIQAHKVPLLSIAFSPDGETFATGSSDAHPIRLWDFATLTAKDYEFRGQAGDVWSLAFSPDGQRLASGTRDGIIRIWDIPNTATKALDLINADEYPNIAFSPDSRFFAGGCKDHTVKIWNVTTHEVVATIRRASYVVAFSEDNERLLVSSKDGHAFWWHIQKGVSEKIPDYGGDLGKVVSVAIASNRRFAALGTQNGHIYIVDMASGLPLRNAFEGHVGAVRSLAFSPDGQKLASGGADMSVMVWDVQTGASLGACQEHKAAVFGIAISPDGKTLASGCGAETIKFWSLDNSLKRSRDSVSLHRSVIRSLSFTPDHRNLASASEDRTVKLWNLATFSKSNVEVASFSFPEPLRAVQFSPDGNTLAAVTDKGTLRLFHASSLAESDRQIAELR